jgi:protein-tyrosine phosphatase
VSPEDRLRDYLLTDEYSTASREATMALIAEHLGPDRAPILEPALVTDRAYLDAAIEEAGTRFGGLDGYLHHGLGLDAEHQRELRHRLTTG